MFLILIHFFIISFQIHLWFLQLYLEPDIEHPEQWKNVDFKGIPKTRDTDRFAKLRWIAGINTYRQWYNRIWGRSIIPTNLNTHHRRVRSYGFKRSFTPDDVADFVVEAISKAARWHKGELLVITLDIQTALDAMEHDTIQDSNDQLQVPPLTKIACIEDLQHETATITLTQDGTSKPFPGTTGGWQGGRCNTIQVQQHHHRFPRPCSVQMGSL